MVNEIQRTRHKYQFIIGVCIGALAGLAPAYYVWQTLHAEEMAAAFVEENDRGCVKLQVAVSRGNGLLARRQRGIAALYAYSEALETARQGLGPLGGEHERALRAQLGTTLEEEGARQKRLWELISAARTTLDGCRNARPEAAASVETATGQPVVGSAEGMGDSAQAPGELVRLAELLNETNDVPDVAELRGVVGQSSGQQTASGSDVAPGRSGTGYYVDWLEQWVYGAGGVAARHGESTPGVGDAHRESVVEARRHLAAGLFSLRIDSERRLSDLVATSEGFRSRLEELIESVELRFHGGGAVSGPWFEARLRLVGSGGVMPLVLPFSASRLGSTGAVAVSTARVQSESSILTEESAQSFTGVVLDARGLSLEPVLLPRVRTPKGNLILDVSAADLNEVAARGFCVYTPYPGSIRDSAGANPVWIRVVGSARPGELTVGEVDGTHLREALQRRTAHGIRLVVLTD